MTDLREAAGYATDPELAAAAETALIEAMGVQAQEKILIITNPEREVLEIASAIYDAACRLGARSVVMIQAVKGQTDEAEDAVIAAIESKPDIVVSLSSEKLGKDREGIKMPYEWDGVSYDHIFHYLLHGAKTLRVFWSPGVSRAMFAKTIPIDYRRLRESCARLKKILDGAVEIRVTNPCGTDIRVGVQGREAKVDDGDYRRPGSGGNLPAGEVFISPRLGTARGVIVFDGSIADTVGDILIREPIHCVVEGGFVVGISGGEEAARLELALGRGASEALRLAAEGKITREQAEAYARNARCIGELGIGLNPAAEIVGNMLQDEKALKTCHFAIGSNYDEDAPALIHLDGLVSRPTIVAIKKDGKETVVERDGELLA